MTIVQHDDFLLLLVATALAIGCLSALLTAQLVRRLRILDIPNDRSSHSTPTPRGGGLAIVCSFMFGMMLLMIAGYIPALPHRQGLLIALLLVAAISFYDDLRSLGLSSRMLVQFLAMAILITTGGADTLYPLGGWALPFALLWIFGLTNAFNFMDGLDGLAASTATIACAFLVFIAWIQGNDFIFLTAGILGAATIGFLIFNWPPAKIFMGDVGSTFLGFTLASLALTPATMQTNTSPLLFTASWLPVVCCLLFHFLFDTVFTFLRRLLHGEKVWQAHRSHLYQLLNRTGYTHRTISLYYSALAIIQGIGTIWMIQSPDERIMPILATFLAIHLLHAAIILRRVNHQQPI